MTSKPFSTTRLVNMTDVVGHIALEAAVCFRMLQDESPELFCAVLALNGIEICEAIYMAQIERQFSSLGVDRIRLDRVGWSKLRLIALYITKANCDHLLRLAEAHSVSELVALMRGEEKHLNARIVLLHLTSEQYEVLEAAVVANGGTKFDDGLLEKEAALIRALRKASEADE